MLRSTKLASRLFFWAGCYGLITLAPLYFLEEALGQAFPPAGNRPEQFYGFLGVALAWQFAFFVIASDVKRFRLMMLPAAAEKVLAATSVIALFWWGRVTLVTLVPALIDLVFGTAFLLVFFRTSERHNREETTGQF
jgi:branched-subunit amino acid transport protein AzlD